MGEWPELPINAWRDSCATLLLYTQIVGKIRLALTPRMNEWWNVPLYVTTRGLTTSPMPYRDRTLSIDFDLIDHELVLEDSTGRIRTLPLTAQPVCDFYAAVFDELKALDVQVTIHPKPQECPLETPLSADTEHASYDRDQVRRFFDVLSRIEPVFQAFRARFRGKCSPVQFFWGTFDLNVSRFNGRRAAPRKGLIERVAYDEEVISLGFWPGDPWGGSIDAGFFSYTIPEPPGFAKQRVRPDAAFYSATLKEDLLPYDAIRRASDPGRMILEFAQSTYDVGAMLGKWDRAALAYP
ncbi:MAG: DUF5996 family protein [Rhizomicrobium sp.]